MTTTESLARVLDAIRQDREAFVYANANRIGGSIRTALKAFLFDYSNGRCFVCDQSTILDCSPSASNGAQIGHLIPASFFGISGMRAGYIPGNCGLQCRACNRAAIDYVFSVDDIIAEYIPTEWPKFKKVSATHDDHAERARLARASRGLPF